MRRRASKLLALMAFLVSVPGTAHALTVSYDPAFQPDSGSPQTYATLIVQAAPGESNDVRHQPAEPANNVVFDLYSGNQRMVLDPSVPGDCTLQYPPNPASELRCSATNPTLIIVSLGDGDDRWDGNAYGASEVVYGGPGNDKLRTGGGSDLVSGDDGNDILSGGPGNDTLDGGPGDDDLENYDDGSSSDIREAGEDDLVGGPGVDRAYLRGRTAGVTVTLDDVANDGSGIDNFKDDVASDVENILGGNGDDTLTGTAGPNEIDGYFGDDTIDAGAGDDKVDGGSDDDLLTGGPGIDLVEGGEGNDRVDGGSGTDTIFGDYPCSAALCDNGNDRIQARDGEIDSVNCGNGADSAVVDYNDAVSSDFTGTCEVLDRSATPVPVAGTPGGNTPAQPTGPIAQNTAPGPVLPVTLPKSAKASAFRAGVQVKVKVAGAATCTATLTVKKKTYATAKASTKKAGTVTLKLKAKKGKTVKKGAGSVSVVCTPKTGAKITATKPLTVK